MELNLPGKEIVRSHEYACSQEIEEDIISMIQIIPRRNQSARSRGSNMDHIGSMCLQQIERLCRQKKQW